MTIGIALGWSGLFGKIGLVLIGLVWFQLTVGILCVMEVRIGDDQPLSCWLIVTCLLDII